MLVKADAPRCGLAAVWHEYISFVVTAQAMAIGLATLVWLLLVDSPDGAEHATSPGGNCSAPPVWSEPG